MIIKEYSVNNLDCAGCSAKIEGEISNLAEVKQANLDVINKRLVIQYHKKSDKALEKLNRIASSIEPGVTITDQEEPVRAGKSHYAKVIFMGIGLWLIASIFSFSAIVTTILMLLAYLMVAGRVLHSALKEVFSRKLLAEHFLMSVASLGAVYLGEYTEAIAVIALYELGQYLEAKAISRSRTTVSSIISLKPEMAHLECDSGTKDIKLGEISKGSILLVYPGERIPLDGEVLKGESSLDASSISGESAPVAVQPGDHVYAGCMNQGGLLEIRVSHEESESMVSRILSLIDNASTRKSRQERFITRFSRVYTPIVVALAFVVFILPTILGYPAAIWFKRSLVFLIVSCPCALVISIPLTYYIGIGIAARKGIIFKGSIFLDGLRRIQSLVFDKTGTLTSGNLKLQTLHPAADVTEIELQRALYICEQNSMHPFALAVKKALDEPYDSSLLHSFKEHAGKGVRLVYDSHNYLAGSQSFLEAEGFKDFEDTKEYSSVHVAVDNTYLGAAGFNDEIKDNMPKSLASLRKQGVKSMYMLSGDKQVRAAHVAKELGLDGFKSELLPSDKLQALESIIHESNHRVAYIGDGMNDAPVLARADIGIAMGAIGAEASIDSADIVLLNDKPIQLVQAFKLSRATNRKVWQNIVLALAIKILVMALGIAGISGLWEAIIADVGVTLLVIFNSLGLSRIDRMLDKK
ncbi:MAG: heavy metal translocating P-type ATPase [Candidatus Cloacimonetes bacterium]|nr:heavy metal translocating P-type ATPase [Candidatus Cloacimonadota bacterium]